MWDSFKEFIIKQLIRIRLRCAEDLNDLSNRIGTSLPINIKSVDLSTGEIKTKKPSVDRGSRRIDWKYEWIEMPEFVQDKQESFCCVEVLVDDIQKLSEQLEQPLTLKSKSIWHPRLDRGINSNKRYLVIHDTNPVYPIYVISKGRAKNCLTVRELELMKVPYSLVVEPTEEVEYRKIVKTGTLLVLPFHDLGQGSIPARNWVWEHSIKEGHENHWILDDNIEGFHRLNRNMKPKVLSGIIFRCAEIFTDRYSNVGLSGLNYYNFCKATDSVSPYTLNTRIYSCILIRNDLPFRWRGRYNEDTDLSLRVLKSGSCTILFNAFLAGKVTTMRMKGGNTDTVYNDGDQRKKFAESLAEQHPDVAKVVWKFNRWHHQVEYSGFKNNLLKRIDDLRLYRMIYNFGMYLTEIEQ